MPHIYIDELSIYSELAPCIALYKNVFNDPKLTIDMIEKQISSPGSGMMWYPAKTLSGSHQKRTNFDLSLTWAAESIENNIAKQISNEFFFTLSSALKSYCRTYGLNDQLFFEDFNVLKYSEGQHYDSHYDGHTATGRSVSAILYLNDNYDGGEIEFTNFNIKYKPSSGDLLLFPSNYAYSHIAHNVYNGIKYAIVTWIKDREM